MKKLPKASVQKLPESDHFHIALGEKFVVSIHGKWAIGAAFLLVVFFKDDIGKWLNIQW